MIYLLTTLLAACDPNDPIGCISRPPYMPEGIGSGGELTGIMVLLNSILKLVFVVAGLYSFVNLIIAGFDYMSAGGDAKKVTKALDRIWQTLLGLVIIVASFLLAAVFGILFFKDPTAILQPKLQ